MLRRFMPISAITALALTACGSSDPPSASPEEPGAVEAPAEQPSDGSTFDFTTSFGGGATPLVVELDPALVEAAGSAAQNVILKRVTVTPYETGTAARCAAELTMEWAPDALEKIHHYSPDNPNAAGLAKSAMGGEPQPMSAMTDEAFETGSPNIIMSEDATTIIRIRQCAAGPMEGGQSASGLRFLSIAPDGRTRDFATLDFNMMADGSINVVNSEVKDFVRDSNGTWVGR